MDVAAFRCAIALATLAPTAFGGWGDYLDPPPEYASFRRDVKKVAEYRFSGFDVEEYVQANGPGTAQRVMVAVPRDAKGPLPAVVAPFYYPEAMLGFDPKTGGVDSALAPAKTNLTYFSEVAYMSELAGRGYVTVSADAYHLTYATNDAPPGAWAKWRHAGERLAKEHPGWTGIGKLTFDTRLLIDFIAADPRVDAGRIGIIGHSLGGKMAFYAGCLDPRVKVIVASDFGIGWDQTNWKDVWYWGDRLKDARAEGLDHSGLLSLSGGKPFCLIAGKYDDATSGELMRRAKGYEGRQDRLLLVNHATGHRPPRQAMEMGYRFLDSYLKRPVAEWITGHYAVPGEDDYAAHFEDAPAPVLSRVFTLAEKPVKRAVWRIASPGMYDASVNGRRVNEVALPIWTAFDRRILEDGYDVTALVKGGANTLTLELGNGWWNPLPMKMWGRYNLRDTLPHGTPAARATLAVEYADGTREEVVTDGTWLAAEGPVLRNNLYLGEKRDARRAATGWRAARIAKDAPKGKVVPRGDMPPIVVYDRWKAKGVSPLPDGSWLVDMGVNFAGTMRATLKGTHDGDVVTFRYGELKHADGTVNVMTGVCGQQKRAEISPPGIAEQRDTVICPAAESFTYEPRFTFHGFRYVEVAGLRTAPEPGDFEALAWSADVKDSAHFECSDAKINLLRDVCRRTFRSNLQGVQSDCPARERFGYGGDLAATAESFVLNYDMAAFYRKVVRDRCDMEALHGVFTSTTPSVFPERDLQAMRRGKFSMGWAVDVPIVIDLLLRYYGDVETVREAYPSLRRFLSRCAEAFGVNRVPPCIGDHEALEKADRTMTAQCHYHQFLKLTAKFARMLGETSDAARFEATASELEAEFARSERYVPAKGFVGNGRQGEECFAIYHGMLTPANLDAAYGILRNDIVAHGHALSTGIFSTQYLLEILTARGDADIAGKVLTHKGFPGWYNMLDNGATTLWETWASSDNIYSQNHPMFGSCAAWLMRGILGIRIAEDAVGCDKVRIEPHAVAGITWAKGHLDTPKGRISVSWRMEGGRMKIERHLPDGVAEL